MLSGRKFFVLRIARIHIRDKIIQNDSNSVSTFRRADRDESVAIGSECSDVRRPALLSDKRREEVRGQEADRPDGRRARDDPGEIFPGNKSRRSSFAKLQRHALARVRRAS